MAGPCSVESRDQILRAAESVAGAGAKVLRGGGFKPRSSPYSFQGLGEEGLVLLREAAERSRAAGGERGDGPTQIPLVAQYADILQIVRATCRTTTCCARPASSPNRCCSKRGIAATIEELLLSAEYIMAAGNYDVILCERGIRTFESYTRNTMDISAIPVVKKLSHLPIVADPSHGTGRRDKVAPMARAAVAGRRRRAAHRSASRSRPGVERRRAVAAARAVHRADGPTADHRAGGGPDDLRAPCRACDCRRRPDRSFVRAGAQEGRVRRTHRGSELGGCDSRRHWLAARSTRPRRSKRSRPRRDLVYLAQPIQRIVETLARLGDAVRPGCLVTDAGSTKTRIVEQGRRSIRRGQFLGGHPMAGKEKRGAAEADADLFVGRTYLLTPVDPAQLETPAAREFIEWIRAIGASVLTMTPEEHDRVVAHTSHLPQLVSTALATTLASGITERGPSARGRSGAG